MLTALGLDNSHIEEIIEFKDISWIYKYFVAKIRGKNRVFEF